MSKILTIVLLLVAVVVIYFIFLSLNAKPPTINFESKHLRPCPGKPNCVCSEQRGEFYIEPLLLIGEADESMSKLRNAIKGTGGTIVEQRNTYLWAVYKSSLFRFVDDLEVRLDVDLKTIQIRSESRSGRSDFGINRKRIEKIRQIFSK